MRDARSGADLCGSGVVAFDGAYREDLTNLGVPGGPCTFYGASERAGTYRVQISQKGYISKEISGLVVSKDDPSDCHISSGVVLTVDLDPDPSAPSTVDAATD